MLSFYISTDLLSRWNDVECPRLCAEADASESKTEQVYIAFIAKLPPSAEKRVIAFGLYGSDLRYTNGAIRNVELSGTYFPGWVVMKFCTKILSKVSHFVFISFKDLPILCFYRCAKEYYK